MRWDQRKAGSRYLTLEDLNKVSDFTVSIIEYHWKGLNGGVTQPTCVSVVKLDMYWGFNYMLDPHILTPLILITTPRVRDCY